MKTQISNRLGVAHVRDTVKQFVEGSLSREQAMASLQIGRTRLYDLRTSYLSARAEGREAAWLPGRSGGNPKGEWPVEEQSFLRRALVPPSGAKRYSFETLNDHVGQLVERRNGHEIHREIGTTPQAAWDTALKEGRTKLRPVPRDGWWPLVWAEWTRTVVGPRGRVLIGPGYCPTSCAVGTKVWLCRHPCGSVSVVLNKPGHGLHPVILFSNHPSLGRS